MNDSPLVSPFRYYNLWRNPFGELTRQERADLAIVDVSAWVELVEQRHGVVQFLGPCGRGKTTHAFALLKALTDVQYVYLPEDKPRPAIGRHRPMIVDESQRLWSWQLNRVLREPGGLVLCTHVNHERALKKARREFVSIEVEANTSSSKLLAILNRRLEASRLGDGTIPQLSKPHVDRLLLEFGSDFRAIEHHLYIEFQNTALKQLPWPLVN